jgi:cathepsin A (carboxypeptidase C)
MLYSKKIVSLLTAGFILVTGSLAATPDRHTIQMYEAQGYKVLTSQKVSGYSVRIKQPSSCEDNIQVKNFMQPMKMSSYD